MESPLVSIVIPCKNYGHYLEEAIKSALGQTYKNIEVITVDDGSTDNSLEVMENFPVKIVEHSYNKGLPFARNTGITAANGELIVPLDADDQLDQQYVTICVAGYLSLPDKNIGIIRTGLVEFKDTGETRSCPPLPFGGLADELAANRIFVSSMFPRKVWEDVGGYSEDMNDGFEDWEFWIKILERGYQVLTITHNLLRYRIHQTSKGRSRSAERTLASKQKMFYKHRNTWKQLLVESIPGWGSKDKEAL
jgi:glycosyltransferase involved in cell wall biosynthesis